MPDPKRPRPSYSFYAAHVPPERHNYVMKEAVRVAWSRWEARLEARLRALGFSKPGPRERWEWFSRYMTPQMWSEMEIKYPKRFESNWKDYLRLRARAAKGDFVEEEAVVV